MKSVSVFNWSIVLCFLATACGQNTSHMPISDLHAGSSGSGSPTPNSTAGGPGGSGSSSDPSSGSGSNPAIGVYYTRDIMPLIQKNCIQCHGPSSAKNWTNYNVFVSEKNLILVRVLGPAANMPLGAKLSASDKQLLQTWIDTGMAYAPPVGPNPGPTPVPGPGPAPQPNPGPGPNPAPGPQPGPTPEPVPQPDPNTPAQVQNCLGCHGDKGQSVVPNFPQLAAQNSMYLSNQLTAFANHTRADADAQTFMWPVASTLSPDDIKVIALYFSSQAPGAPQPAGDPQKIAAGKLLYESGIPTNNVPACLACHGTGAVGRQNFPRLAGQFKDYLTKQLNAFKDGSRADETTMPSFSKKLTDEQIDNLTEYLQSL